MNHLVVLTALLIGLPAVWGLGDEDIRCVSSSCKVRVRFFNLKQTISSGKTNFQDVECDAVPEKCKSNETNAGLYMLSPDICNCCDYCLEYMGKFCQKKNTDN